MSTADDIAEYWEMALEEFNENGDVFDKEDAMTKFELKITTAKGKDKIVTWSGKDGVDAATRYADAHRGSIVFATRPIRHGIFVPDVRRMRD